MVPPKYICPNRGGERERELANNVKTGQNNELLSILTLAEFLKILRPVTIKKQHGGMPKTGVQGRLHN